MADVRSIVTGASLALALVCAGWAVYEAKHDAPAGSFQGGQGRPGGQSGGQSAGQRGGQGGGGQGGGQFRPAGQGGAVGGDAIPVLTAIAERRQIDVGIQAIGTANSNESVSVT